LIRFQDSRIPRFQIPDSRFHVLQLTPKSGVKNVKNVFTFLTPLFGVILTPYN
jgi:hypothetical protein